MSSYSNSVYAVTDNAVSFTDIQQHWQIVCKACRSERTCQRCRRQSIRQDIGSVDAAYLEDVRLMVKLTIMTGTAEDAFSPKSETTRAQAAAVFTRTLQALGMLD